MLDTLKALRKKAVIGFVGGSDLPKQMEQLGVNGANGGRSPLAIPLLSSPRADRAHVTAPTVIDDFDYCFAENGLTAYKSGKQLASASFIKHIGEERYKAMVKVILHHIADLDIPVKR